MYVPESIAWRTVTREKTGATPVVSVSVVSGSLSRHEARSGRGRVGVAIQDGKELYITKGFPPGNLDPLTPITSIKLSVMFRRPVYRGRISERMMEKYE